MIMTAINNNLAVGATYTVHDGPSPDMTPEQLLSYCQTRLQSLAEEIRKQTDQQHKYSDENDVISKLQEQVSHIVSTEKNKVSPKQAAAIQQAYETAADQLAHLGDPKAAARIRGLEKRFEQAMQCTINFNDGSSITPSSDADPNTDWMAVRQAWDKAGVGERFVFGSLYHCDFHGPDSRSNTFGLAYSGKTFKETELKSTDVQKLSEDIKNVQSMVNENSQLGLDELRNLNQQRQTALQIVQQLVQAMADQMHGTQQWK